MASSADDQNNGDQSPGRKRTGRKIAAGLLLGIICGILFGDYCEVLQVIGQAYVGLLQMTVLPYLVLSLISKTAQLNGAQARRLGVSALLVLLAFWLIGIALIVLVANLLPPAEGATFFSSAAEASTASDEDFLSRYIPANVFHSLASEYVPAVVVFSLFFGGALMLVPGKEPLLHFLDLCSASIGHMNMFLVKLAPLGLFTLTAAAAGTMRLDELSRLQAYLMMFALACAVAAFGILPLLVSSFTSIGYRQLLRAANEPLLTAIATGKLFVVLPQIVEQCERLEGHDGNGSESEPSTAKVVVPLAYPFPHVGKILSFVFVSFAAWYVGQELTLGQTTAMAATGAVSSFASPLISMPYLLDQYQLPQDLMALFILPGFITTRLADIVGVMHLMALSLIISQVVRVGFQVRWKRLLVSLAAMMVCLGMVEVAGRWYLAQTTVKYDLDQRLLSLEIPDPHPDVVVYRSRSEAPQQPRFEGSTLDRIRTEKVLRVGYHPDHLPYSFFNNQQHLVGLDVELMHRLARDLKVRLEFIPYQYHTLVEQLNSGEIDLALGGLMMKPQRQLVVGFTQPYQTATVALVVPDHRRREFDAWDDPHMPRNAKLGVVHDDLAAAARRQLPDSEIVVIDSIRSFFTRQHDLDGLIIAAEEGAAWNVLYPEHAVIVPHPVIRRPIAMAVRSNNEAFLRFLDGVLEFEQLDGSLERLRAYWTEGGGTKIRPPRWSVLRNVLGWAP